MLKNIYRTSSRLVSFNSRSFSAASLIRIPRLYNLTRPTQHCRLQTSVIRRTMSAEEPKHTNRLAQEKSPYLLQHAHNPVDWYPWGDEAIQKAKDENKVIFLSVGYSTCHWCHVMEHESFENEDVAKIMNENFVNIKVDREERPDIDKIYMQFVTLMNGSGGWPMSVWLTPNLAPIMAGTYFPPKSRWGMPGFDLVLTTLADKWKTEQQELTETGQKVIDSIRNNLRLAPGEEVREVGSAEGKMHEAVGIFEQRFDDTYGGFGVQPKFPEVSRLNFLLHAYIVSRDDDAFNMATLTLKKIGNGGIHDHVFGGFSRYAVDRRWHVPHFEKMLYDQGQLMTSYSNAYKITNDRLYLDIADGIYRYVVKDLRHPSGGFFSGEDADSLPTATDTVKVEGAFYAWKWSDIRDAINNSASKYTMTPEEVFEIYCHHYSLKEEGNVEPPYDPHKNFTGKNILIVRKSLAETAVKFKMDEDDIRDILRITNNTLHEIRELRPRPHLDTKIITSWNGLMLSGLSKLANCQSEDREKYLKTAEELYKFARKSLFNEEKKMLIRSCYGNGDVLAETLSEPIDGFVDDYAFLIRGLLDYYKASLDVDALLWARELQDIQDSLFWDQTNGAYYFSQANSPNVVMRLKGDTDGAEPCGNSVASRNLILLSHYFDDENYEEKAVQLFAYFSGATPFGFVLPEMLSSLILYEYGLDLVAVVGPDTELTKKFVQICQQFYIPGMIIVHVDPEKPNICSEKTQDKYKMVNGKPTVYICHNKVCRMPVNDPELLEDNLRENYTADDDVLV